MEDTKEQYLEYAKQATEETSEEMKALIDEMNQYAKETIEMKKATYEWIVDSMEAAVKSAEKLSDEIDWLKTKIDELNQDETTDVASAFLEAEQTLKDYKKEYEWIVELAQQFTKDQLENQNIDCMIIVGDPHSNNTRKLEDVAKKIGIPNFIPYCIILQWECIGLIVCKSKTSIRIFCSYN